MKLTCTWSPEQVSNFATFHCFFWPFPLLPRVPRIDSVQNRLMEARNRREARHCQSRLTDLWFIIDLLGNATIGNDHFGTLGRQNKQTKKIIIKKKTGQQAKSAARPPGNDPVLPMASPRLVTSYLWMILVKFSNLNSWVNVIFVQYSYLYCVYNSFYGIKLLYAISVWIISDRIGCDASGTS